MQMAWEGQNKLLPGLLIASACPPPSMTHSSAPVSDASRSTFRRRAPARSGSRHHSQSCLTTPTVRTRNRTGPSNNCSGYSMQFLHWWSRMLERESISRLKFLRSTFQRLRIPDDPLNHISTMSLTVFLPPCIAKSAAHYPTAAPHLPALAHRALASPGQSVSPGAGG